MIRNHQVLFWALLTTLTLPSISLAQQKGALWLYPNLNASWLQSDLNTNPTIASSTIGPGGGLRIGPSPHTKRLAPAFQAGLGRVTAQNPDMQPVTDPATNTLIFPNKYVETTLFQTEVAFRYQLTRRNKVNPYLMAGAGLQFYFAKDQGGVPLILDQATRPLSEATYNSLTVAFPMGVGFSYAISPGLEIQGEYTFRFLGSDHLDNIASLGSRTGNDRIQSVNIAVGIPLGKIHADPAPVVPVQDSAAADSPQIAGTPPQPDSLPSPTPAPLPDTPDTCASPCLAFEAMTLPVTDSSQCDSPCLAFEVETVPVPADSLLTLLSPPMPPAHSAQTDSLQVALASQSLMNQLLRERIRVLEERVAQHDREQELLAARLVAQSARIEKMAYDSTQWVLLAKNIDDENTALSQQLRQKEANCLETTQRLRDSMEIQKATIAALQRAPLAPPAAQTALAAEGQLAATRTEALEQKLTEFNRRELELKQLQQTSAYLVTQQEASMAQDVFVLPVSAKTKDRPLTEWLAANQYVAEKAADGAQVYFGVLLPEVSASSLRLRIQTTRLSTGQWVVQVLARRTSDGVWISPVSSPAEADLLGKWLLSLY